MTAAAFDTSVLVKLVVVEEGTPSAREVWSATAPPVCSRFAYVEARAALAAARRMRLLTQAQLASAKRALEALWSEVVVVEVTEALAMDAAEIAERRSLRAYDAIHIATARAASVAALVTADEDQRKAALAEGLVAIDPRSIRARPQAL